MPSFDVVSEIDAQEVRNAVDQASRELSTRFDFKGSSSKVELKDKELTVWADSDFQISQVMDIVLAKLAKRKPHQLSGGQQQRVALARSLAKGPKLLLLDEPMGALDKKLRSQMQLELVNIIETSGVTCVMVTHDQEEAMTMATRIALMDSGRIRQVGTPDEIYESPTSRFAAEFIGSVNMFHGKIEEAKADYVTIV